jgi:hypothetical protein
MKRPIINTIGLIRNQERVAIRIQIDLKLLTEIDMPLLSEIEEFTDPTSPWKNIRFFPRKRFRLLIEGLNEHHRPIFKKEFTNDNYGQFLISVPSYYREEKLVAFKFFETSVMPSVQCFLGHFFPLDLPPLPKIIISDLGNLFIKVINNNNK